MMIDKTSFLVPLVSGLAAAAFPFLMSAGAEGRDFVVSGGEQAEAVFAGGCFWCVESDFEKLEGVHAAISGYTGGTIDMPTYKNHSKKGPGVEAHYEAVKIIYDPQVVSYDELLDYYWRHVDPTDAGGQFCDRGDSYRTAIFVADDEQKDLATDSKAELVSSDVLPSDVVTPIIELGEFWRAEEYHQDYYKKNPLRYRFYRTSCGRDKRVADVWSKEAPNS